MRRFLITTAAAVAACSNDSAVPTARVATVRIAPVQATIDGVGKTVQFSAQPLDADGQVVLSVVVTWSSTDASTVEIGPGTGIATGKKPGTATVKAAAGDVSGSATAVVLPPATVTVVTASRLQTGTGSTTTWRITAQLRNAGASGAYRVEFYSFPINTVNPPPRLWASTETVEVGPAYSETVSWTVPVTAGNQVEWLIVYSRDIGTANYRQTARYDF